VILNADGKRVNAPTESAGNVRKTADQDRQFCQAATQDEWTGHWQGDGIVGHKAFSVEVLL
jgi:hypothetical protein